MRLINRTPGRVLGLALAATPFAATIVIYAVASHFRRLENPADKLLPSIEQMAATFWRLAAVPDRRTGDLVLWVDTFDSLWRLGFGMAVATAFALITGILIGFVPHIRAALAPYISAISLIPPITVLPILFIVVGLGEASKVMLVALGTAPVMTRATAQAVMEIPGELVIKAQTLGANTWQMMTRLVLPQVLPRLITALRLGLVPGWIFLISAEAIASTSGLGYRIFLVRRFLAMDVILPYVIWITLLAYVIDRLLLLLSMRAFRWAHLQGGSL
ncbi:MAG: ABC transporter permease [Roseitalea sp.]|jgi:NitT/TauT family transport system permease protein|uniref:ABC transporter permease n=1 Tax=Oceaniradius stylonematis TaxID=2184161 RepID=UPI000F401E10|nr:ABC transporter permease [Oceaniradius stylonematis]MBO6552060.1 ABC transporter permease [Roseitalea sp.]MBO6951560.1 ABC transporter permease [Rhizobiaceae bacterium]RNC95970.1 MAG: ABC transporter permease [Oricola sp.]MBO6592594.1 ABC transporter permease [Roseitalea sp.]MBO6598849.1 ABC transporter permease [Roseitalea sp.]